MRNKTWLAEHLWLYEYLSISLSAFPMSCPCYYPGAVSFVTVSVFSIFIVNAKQAALSSVRLSEINNFHLYDKAVG